MSYDHQSADTACQNALEQESLNNSKVKLENTVRVCVTTEVRGLRKAKRFQKTPTDISSAQKELPPYPVLAIARLHDKNRDLRWSSPARATVTVQLYH